MRNPHYPPEGLGSLWRRPGDVLGREFSLSLPTSRFHTLPGSLWGALGSISESFRLPKMMIFERVVWSFPRALFAARFGFLRYFLHLVCWVVGSRAQTGQMRKLTHLPCENLLFQGTRQRRARHRKGNRRPKTTPTVFWPQSAERARLTGNVSGTFGDRVSWPSRLGPVSGIGVVQRPSLATQHAFVPSRWRILNAPATLKPKQRMWLETRNRWMSVIPADPDV